MEGDTVMCRGKHKHNYILDVRAAPGFPLEYLHKSWPAAREHAWELGVKRPDRMKLGVRYNCDGVQIRITRECK